MLTKQTFSEEVSARQFRAAVRVATEHMDYNSRVTSSS